MPVTTELIERIRRHAGRRESLAVREIATGHGATYAQLAAWVTEFGRTLRAAAPDGGTVVLRISNCINFYVAFLAALNEGYNAFPVTPDLTGPELEVAVRRCAAAAVVAADLTVATVARPGSDRGIAPPGPALLLQSSGTTGLPKVVRREAAAVDAVAANMVEAIGFTADDRVLAAVPLCHSYGLEHGLLAPLWAGAAVHLQSGFDLHAVCREMTASAITTLPGVPSMFEMLGTVGEEAVTFPALRAAYSAGAPLPAKVADTLRAKYGMIVSQLYGATELGSVTYADPRRPDFNPASVGKPMGGVDLRIGDDGGALWIKAPSMLSGYVGEGSPVDADGFFPTGDLAAVDDRGNLVITGRVKLLIDVGGLKVNPLEVEAVLVGHPAVEAAVVVPVNLSETIARVKAVIVRRRGGGGGGDVTGDDLRRFCRARLTGYKVPRVFEFRDELPRSAAGKVLRHLVR